MKSILTLAVVLAVTGGALLLMQPSKSRVVTKAALTHLTQDKMLPAIVSLSKEGQTFCSATVISDTEVLTAAHCVAQMSPFGMMVADGVNVDSLDQEVSVPTTVAGLNPRQDTAILTGDFKMFKKANLDTSPTADILVNDYELATCGFPWGGELVCYSLSHPIKEIDVIGFEVGQMYAGMSGGPVIDLKSGKVVAVNHAVARGEVIVAPVVNMFDALIGVK